MPGVEVAVADKVVAVVYFAAGVTLKLLAAEELELYDVVPAKIAFNVCVPTPRRKLSFAVPAEVNCACPRSAGDAQALFTEVSQKVTTPGATAVAPELTVAVSVTNVPVSTVDTLLPPDVSVSKVEVEGGRA